jgi:arylsulfatase A-like enzyme
VALEFVGMKRRTPGVASPRKPVPEGTNIVLISLDTVRADHLGVYGYHRKTSPVIDALAAQGATFDRAVSPSSWTLPAHMSIFTSLYPSFHGLERSGERWNVRLAGSERTMAQYLKESGYATAAFTGNPFLNATWGFDRGFDLYRQYMTDAKAQVDRASLWLQWHAHRVDRKLASASFFLFLHLNDAHIPYTVPAEFRKKFPVEPSTGEEAPPGVHPCVAQAARRDSPDLDSARAHYDAEINYIDTHLGRLFRLLQALGWKDSTLLILTADHGEEFGDHGDTKHKATLYEEVLRVPLVITFPRVIAAGQRIGGSVSLLDILPTMLEAIGRERPPRLQGVSLLPYIRRNGAGAPAAPPRTREIFAELGPLGLEWEMPVHRKAVSTSDQKLIVTYVKGGGTTKELYDLVADPRERCNAYSGREQSSAVRRLEERLGGFIREGVGYRQAQASEEGFEPNEELLEQLRSLGYID